MSSRTKACFTLMLFTVFAASSLAYGDPPPLIPDDDRPILAPRRSSAPPLLDDAPASTPRNIWDLPPRRDLDRGGAAPLPDDLSSPTTPADRPSSIPDFSSPPVFPKLPSDTPVDSADDAPSTPRNDDGLTIPRIDTAPGIDEDERDVAVDLLPGPATPLDLGPTDDVADNATVPSTRQLLDVYLTPPASTADAVNARLMDEAASLASLLKQRRDTLRDRAAEYRRLYRAGQIALRSVLDAHRELLNAELELSPRATDRIAICRQQLDYAKRVEQVADERGSAADKLDCKTLRLNLEIMLHRETTSGRGVAQLAVLRERVAASGEMLRQAVQLQEVGARGGEGEVVMRAAIAHSQAVADLAVAENRLSGAQKHLRNAVVFAEDLCLIVQASYENGAATAEAVLLAQLVRSQVKLRLLEIEEKNAAPVTIRLSGN